MKQALSSAPAGWMAETTRSQLGRLKTLLARLRA
jgi:hypothetical protein